MQHLAILLALLFVPIGCKPSPGSSLAGLSNASLTFYGNLVMLYGLTGQTRTFDVGVTPNASLGVGLTINATILDGGVNKTGAGRMNLNSSANSYTGTTTVSGGGTLGIAATGSLGNEAATTNSLALSNGTLALGSGLFFTTTRSLTLGTASFSCPGNGLVLFTGSGTTTWLGQPVTVISGQLQLARTGGSTTVTPGSSITVNAGATLVSAGTISAVSDGVNHVSVVNNGQFTTGQDQVGDLDGTGNTTLNGVSLTANHIRQNSLTINPNNKAIIRPGGGNASVSTLNSISIGTSASFNLANNKPPAAGDGATSAVAFPFGFWDGTAYTAIAGAIQSGRNGVALDGGGIQTSVSAARLYSVDLVEPEEVSISDYGSDDISYDGKINISDYRTVNHTDGIMGSC